jgi:Tetratricopeptide repeat
VVNLQFVSPISWVLCGQGKYEQAEETHGQALQLRKTVLGSKHPSTLTSMKTLASNFWNQGRFVEAEELEVQALKTRTRLLGTKDPGTLSSMANLEEEE